MKRVDPKVYTREYYLLDCEGYGEFLKTRGEGFSSRFNTIIKKTPDVKGKTVLDIGCGRGEVVFWCSRNGAKETIGIDYSNHAIKIAKEARGLQSGDVSGKVLFKKMDAKKIRFEDEKFDMVFMIEILEHLYPKEQDMVMREVRRILKKDGVLVFHTAPGLLFNNYTYKYWCYPLSTILVKISNLLTGNDYGNILKPSEIRSDSHKVMHVNEPDYFSLKKLFERYKLKGNIESTNVTVLKPILSYKDALYNLIVYLYPISIYYPFNILWGNDFCAVLKKK